MTPLPTPRINAHQATAVGSQSKVMDEIYFEGELERMMEQIKNPRQPNTALSGTPINSNNLAKEEMCLGGAVSSNASVISPTAEVELCVETSSSCAICKELLKDRAMVMPCGHLFDLMYIRNWLDQLNKIGRAARQCPLCRTGMDEIRHNFSGDTVFESQVPFEEEPVDLISILLDPPEVQREMRSRYLSIRVRDPPFVVTIEREIRLRIIRIGLSTGSLLARFLDVTYEIEEESHSDSIVDNDAAIRDYEKAKGEVHEEIGDVNEWISMDNGNSITAMIPGSRITFWDQRGIRSNLLKRMRIDKSLRYPGKVVITWETILSEDGPASPDEFLRPIEVVVPQVLSSEEGLQVLSVGREAREEIQSTLDWFGRQGDPPEPFGLDRVSTNLLEPRNAEFLCRYCIKEHRNGDCLLPWGLSGPSVA